MSRVVLGGLWEGKENWLTSIHLSFFKANACLDFSFRYLG